MSSSPIDNDGVTFSIVLCLDIFHWCLRANKALLKIEERMEDMDIVGILNLPPWSLTSIWSMFFLKLQPTISIFWMNLANEMQAVYLMRTKKQEHVIFTLSLIYALVLGIFFSFLLYRSTFHEFIPGFHLSVKYGRRNNFSLLLISWN